MSVCIPISIGELWDKYSILLIKREKIKNKEKQNIVKHEIELLDSLMNNYSYTDNEFFINLKSVNEKLWEIEDKIRIKEKNNSFDSEFVDLARSVYFTNDKRAEIKNAINKTYNSNICEVKEYINYNN
jgi:hypothetical protein